MPALLFLAFLIVPLLELAVIVQVQARVGLGWTILALIVISLGGAALVKREGLKAWRRFREALAQARLPAAEVVDGALLLVAGALLLTPGFLTDAVGLLFLLPPTRALVNRALRGRVRRSLGFAPPRRPAVRDEAIDVQIVDVRRDREPRPGASDEAGHERP